MLPGNKQTDSNKYRDNKEIIFQTAEQVIKDFALFGMEITFPEEMEFAYDILFDQLKPIIAQMFDSNNRLLLSLLYQIDVSEYTIKKQSQQNPDIPITDLIADLILDREFKKVITRNYFKEKGI